jgi:hypothetical protein
MKTNELVAMTSRMLLVLGAMHVLFWSMSGPAIASCNSFVISVSPATVSEGEAVTVTVTRDGADAPSSVVIATVGETATPGRDFPSVKETINFDKELSQQRTIPIFADDLVEGVETFSVTLSEPSGCGGDTDYVLSADAYVSIADGNRRPPQVRPASLSQTGGSDVGGPAARARAEAATADIAAVVPSARPTGRSGSHALPSRLASAGRVAAAERRSSAVEVVAIVVCLLAAGLAIAAFVRRKRTAIQSR